MLLVLYLLIWSRYVHVRVHVDCNLHGKAINTWHSCHNKKQNIFYDPRLKGCSTVFIPTQHDRHAMQTLKKWILLNQNWLSYVTGLQTIDHTPFESKVTAVRCLSLYCCRSAATHHLHVTTATYHRPWLSALASGGLLACASGFYHSSINSHSHVRTHTYSEGWW